MAIRIFSDLPSLAAQPNLGPKNDRRGATPGRTASGNPTPQSGDNSAGRVLSETLRPDNRVLKQTSRDLAEGSTTENNSAPSALAKLVEAVDQLTRIRTNAGEAKGPFKHALSNLNSAIENLTTAPSPVGEADSAEKLARLTGDQIRTQSATARVGHANLLPQGVFGLIEVP